MSDKILKLDQAQTLYQDLRERIDVLPTNEDITVTDVQINGTSILNDGIANVPMASANNLGLVKINNNYGIVIDPATGNILTYTAGSNIIKEGTNQYRPIVPHYQQNAVFYGLATAAGDTTQSQSSNSIGSYTDIAKEKIQSMLGITQMLAPENPNLVATQAYSIGDVFAANGHLYKAIAAIAANGVIITDGANANCIECNISDNLSDKVAKAEIEYAGISKYTYSTKFGGEFSVTTATTSGWLNPYVRASVTGRINKENMHRVTFNGTEYILRTRLWYEKDNNSFKVYEYLGNLGLYIESTAGVPGGTDNVPFIIISDLNNSSSIDVITQTAGTYTILVEQINPTKIDLPKSLIWGDSYVPIEKNNNGGTYNGFSFGVNELNNKRGTFAFGYANKIENQFSAAIGTSNQITGNNGYAIGISNQITGSAGIAIGGSNQITGDNGVAIGDSLNVNSLMTAVGKHNVAANTTFPDWANNTQYHKGDIVYAVWNPSSSATSPRLCFLCLKDHVSSESGRFYDEITNNDYFLQNVWTLSPSTGDTVFVIGNGNNISRSNAMKVDWVGNIYLGGNAYVNANSDSTGGIKLATENIIAIQDTQPTGTDTKIWLPETAGTSIQVPTMEDLGDYVQKTDIATQSQAGIVKPNLGFGIGINLNSQLYLNRAELSQIKAGTDLYRPIVPNEQHVSVFYGLAKAAGDTTQSASSNAVGTYTDNAKASIKSMLGIVDGSTGTVDITGATPTITAVENTRYVCGEVTSLDFTPAASGICIVRFTSGSTVTVLTLPSTVKFPEWFDPTTLETNTIYEICITDGIYGAVMSWVL